MGNVTKQSFWKVFSLDSIFNYWRSLDIRYKMAFGILLTINLSVFLYGIIQYPIGDHDLRFFDKLSSKWFTREGRWFPIILSSLHMKVPGPVYVQLLTIVLQIIAAIFMILLWYPEARCRDLVIGGLIVSINPFVNDYHYYHFLSYGTPFTQLMMIVSLMLCANKWRWQYIGLGVIFIFISLSTYSPAILTFAIGWSGLLCLRLSRWDCTASDLKKIIVSLAPAVFVALAGITLHLMSQSYFEHTGILLDKNIFYNLQRRPITEIPFAIWPTLVIAFKHLWYSHIFFPKSLKVLLLILTIWGASCLLIKRDGLFSLKLLIARSALLILSFIFMIFCSKIIFLTAMNSHFASRLAVFSIPFVYLFFILAVLTSTVKPFRELCSFLLIFVIFPLMAICDLRAQETFVRLEQHDFAVANRVLSRLESDLGPELYKDDLIFVKFGEWESLADRLNPGSFDIMGNHAYTPLIRLAPDKFLRRLSASFNPSKTLELDLVGFGFSPNKTMVKAAHLAEGLDAWPAKKFFALDGNLLVLVFNKQEVYNLLDTARDKGVIKD